MQKSAIQFAIACIFFTQFSACKEKESPDNKNPNPKDSTINLELGSPVETRPTVTKYAPAFIGQTRVGSLKTKTLFQFQILSSNLKDPWGIAALPNGKLIITEQGGTMRTMTTDGVLSGSIANVPPVYYSGQGGLLGICVDPNFMSNRMLYWAFSESVSGGSITSVAKGRLSENEDALESVSVIYRSNTPYNGNLHFGARIVMDNSGNLLISLGERSDANIRNQAQSVSSSLGKVIRITAEGQPAPNNPKFDGTGALEELYTMGHRNPQGLAIHPITGQIWLGEFGPKAGDEINLLNPGKNYGWPVITYGIEYSGQKVGQGIQQKENMEQPVYYWDPAISPSGMTFYKGNKIPEWQNNLFVGALGGTHIARLHVHNNKVLGEERLLIAEQQRFRDITQGSDGALYAVTDAGRVYKIDKP
jgi:glucose/arabinose dehydrogenase